jgi:hypothetical protein
VILKPQILTTATHNLGLYRPRHTTALPYGYGKDVRTSILGAGFDSDCEPTLIPNDRSSDPDHPRILVYTTPATQQPSHTGTARMSEHPSWEQDSTQNVSPLSYQMTVHPIQITLESWFIQPPPHNSPPIRVRQGCQNIHLGSRIRFRL